MESNQNNTEQVVIDVISDVILNLKYEKLSLGHYPTEEDIKYFRELNGLEFINSQSCIQ